ncbi:MAG: RtcB family protein [Candidatus Kaelpia aquatica]|nr:RtcB family protein [Candidatus Kaelpia aquatica]
MITSQIERVDNYRWRIPRDYQEGMRVPGIVYATEDMFNKAIDGQAFKQVANVAHLPGIVKYSLAMPDIHWGYGFPIGGVAATDPDNGGVISPGGVGYDINCGLRLLRSNLEYEDIKKEITNLVSSIYSSVPAGVGSKGDLVLSKKEERNLLIKGARWAVERGFGVKEDLTYCEENGQIDGADPDKVSDRAYERGRDQCGTLGSGNHFLEIQVIAEIYDEPSADSLGLKKGAITIMIHTGSRGFGYQVCDDYLKTMVKAVSKYNINIPDRQLASAPINSSEAKDYIGAMRCAANYAWANRQYITHLIRAVFEKYFNQSRSSLGLNLVYDVAHNIAKFEKHIVDGEEKTLCVHRKGATRAFGPNHAEIPEDYKDIGQPVIIPGDMGTASYLLLGTERAMKESFGSTCHGAGRVMSRTEAIKKGRNRSISKELKDRGIFVLSRGKKTLLEEMPDAYKDIDQVVNVVVSAGISKKVCKMRPLGVIKG